ncbi:Protein HHL1 [Carex littledalei]|uniref:Protein HHL1 n=1 Tax=Carex littledalei TaxID=544730 RepID=A0A833QTM5_9POAL|nr:Protein HHL1 [Carex littledalei]
MEVTSMSSLRSMVRSSLSQPKPTWANPTVFSAGVPSLKKKRNGLVVVGKTPSKNDLRLVSLCSSPQKVDPNGNPKFIIFVRNADLAKSSMNKWFPLAMVEGSLTAKQILSKNPTDDTIASELASVIYKDEKEIEKEAKLKLNNATKFRYGFKLVLPRKEERKSAWANEAKESFGKLTSLNLNL